MNKHEKLERTGETSFDTSFVTQGHAESIKKIWVPFRIYQLTSNVQITQLWPDWLCYTANVSPIKSVGKPCVAQGTP